MFPALDRPPRGADLHVKLAGSAARGKPSRSPDSVTRALDWLERAQGEDGSWEAGDVSVTALATLALLSGGRTHHTDDTVRRALSYLFRHQDADGGVAGSLNDHALATLALCEAYASTGSNRVRGPAQRGIDFLMAAWNPGAGWAILAVHSADRVGLAVDREAAYADARAWLDGEPDATSTTVAAALRLPMDRRRDTPRVENLESDQETDGSWRGGSVRATAMAALALQTARRYP